MKTAATILAWALGAHVLVKFAFFAMPYRRRRAALDRAYGNELSATATSDWVLMLIVVALGVVLFLGGVNAVSFLTGIWIGATLIQTYFHRYPRRWSLSGHRRRRSGRSSSCPTRFRQIPGGRGLRSPPLPS
jgi:hypothetical protein